ncbi:hypothetical protein M404DRAFT_551716 [Pisolithus tinctorius Marx 270]|uniref:Uncharacterized protein n=1 Tax=Pisolithus tinctorius Marx 270 TaxID=870435 RepID=A0A0C3PA85_PISTI|nr:hypothetical protein M404DRAFT_551716 [Pisolithus tinctorius Marx 270]
MHVYWQREGVSSTEVSANDHPSLEDPRTPYTTRVCPTYILNECTNGGVIRRFACQVRLVGRFSHVCVQLAQKNSGKTFPPLLGVFGQIGVTQTKLRLPNRCAPKTSEVAQFIGCLSGLIYEMDSAAAAGD